MSTSSKQGGVSMGSRLPSPRYNRFCQGGKILGVFSHGHKRGRGARKILLPKAGDSSIMEHTLPNLAVFYFLIWQAIALLSPYNSKAIALHNVSYYTHIHIICPFYDTLYL